MVECSQNLGILTRTAQPDLNATFKVYSFTNTVAHHQKRSVQMFPPLGIDPGLSSKLPIHQRSCKTTEPQTKF